MNITRRTLYAINIYIPYIPYIPYRVRHSIIKLLIIIIDNSRIYIGYTDMYIGYINIYIHIKRWNLNKPQCVYAGITYSR